MVHLPPRRLASPWWLGSLLAVVISGCGGSSTPPAAQPNASATPTADGATPTPPANGAAPGNMPGMPAGSPHAMAGGHGQATGAAQPHGQQSPAGATPPTADASHAPPASTAGTSLTPPAGLPTPPTGAGVGHGQSPATAATTPGPMPPTAGAAHAPPVGATSTNPTPPGGSPTPPSGAGHGQANAGAATSGPTPPAAGAAHAPAGANSNPTGTPMPPTGAGHGQAAAGANSGGPKPPMGANGAGGNNGGPMPPGAPGGQGGSQFAAGSAEDTLQKFCIAMSEGNLTSAAEYVSPRAKGTLLQIRDGQLSDDKVNEFKEAFVPSGLTLKPSRNAGGVGKTINLGNAKGQTLSFTLSKEEDVYKLREFTISKPKK